MSFWRLIYFVLTIIKISIYIGALTLFFVYGTTFLHYGYDYTIKEMSVSTALLMSALLVLLVNASVATGNFAEDGIMDFVHRFDDRRLQERLKKRRNQ